MANCSDRKPTWNLCDAAFGNVMIIKKNSTLKILSCMKISNLILLCLILMVSFLQALAQEEEESPADAKYSKFVLHCVLENGAPQRMTITYNDAKGQWEFVMAATQLCDGMMHYNKHENSINLYCTKPGDKGEYKGDLKATFSNFTPTDVDDFILNGADGKGEIWFTRDPAVKFTWSIMSKS
jgi:hypothetical protein